jgi:hypothetical protein
MDFGFMVHGVNAGEESIQEEALADNGKSVWETNFHVS